MRRYLFIFFIPLLFTVQVYATTILKVGMDELAKQSELIFEGKVISKEVRPSPIDGQPCTYFRFSILDVIKGDYHNSEIELCFAGGTLNGITMQVSEMTMPTVGETGIYFVDSLGKELTHPLFGWHQGHYLVKKDSSQVERVVPAHPEPVLPDGEAERKVQKMEDLPDVETFKQMIRDRM